MKKRKQTGLFLRDHVENMLHKDIEEAVTHTGNKEESGCVMRKTLQVRS